MKDCPPVGELFSPRVDGGEAGVQVLGQQSGQGVAGGVSGCHYQVCQLSVGVGGVTVRGCKGVVRRRGEAKRRLPSTCWPLSPSQPERPAEPPHWPGGGGWWQG